MLTVDTAAATLQSLDFISPQDVVFGDLTIRSAAKRNRNLRVQRRGGRGYLIKQPDEASAKITIAAEAHFYEFCSNNPSCVEVRRFLPEVAYFDSTSSTLYLVLVEPAKNLWPVFGDEQQPAVAERAARSLGTALATVHQTFSEPEILRSFGSTTQYSPWILQVHRPSPATMATISAANYETLSIIQGEREMCRRLDELADAWQPSTLMHGDVKGDNVLWSTTGSADGSVRIVDWEMVQRGDPAWDVAGCFQDLLLFWLSLLPPDESIDEMVEGGKRPLRTIHPIFRSFWRGYSAAYGRPDRLSELLPRAVRFTGGRLIQSAYEMATYASVLPLRAVLALQLSANLLNEPESAQVQLMGIFDDF